MIEPIPFDFNLLNSRTRGLPSTGYYHGFFGSIPPLDG
ncbi:hypothetical protein EUBVEN_00002 [Eubacterium ventriosum ATCC 27560]|uniref:Uncharacterized protein n=1 Tax=Eubacterium ventriosum ATCC 27560 TaxID=411463 RepID=A5Z2X8_9FIRM|nr:hypothetical protein EUBVEN_00002 [Eubacterium ventriosum ATCC 27560]